MLSGFDGRVFLDERMTLISVILHFTVVPSLPLFPVLLLFPPLTALSSRHLDACLAPLTLSNPEVVPA